MMQETYCIIHVFGLAKSVKLHHMRLDISIKYIVRIAQNRCIYKLQNVPVLARFNILLKCFSYNVFMAYIQLRHLILKVNIIVHFYK